MTKLIMMQGLPGSGKSYIAKELAEKDGYTIVEKDVIRKDLVATGWVWSPEAEKADVVPTRDRLIEKALVAGHSVISSDTNFQQEHKIQLSKLARRHGASFEIRRVDVPLETCIARNAAREEGQVPEGVIRGMYDKFIKDDYDRWPLSAQNPYTELVRYVKDETLMPTLICDLDGTLALMGDRSPYDASQCDILDSLNTPVYQTIRVYHDHLSFQIIYLSGREEKDREPTERFLAKHACPPGPLYMRPTSDTRKDRVVKMEIFDAKIRGKYNVKFALDDRNQVVRMWRELGIPCFQVADGDF